MGFLGHRNCFICLFIYCSIIFETRSYREAQAGLGSKAVLSPRPPDAEMTDTSQYAQPTLFFFYTMGAKKLPGQEASPHSLCLTNSYVSVSSLLRLSSCAPGSSEHLGPGMQRSGGGDCWSQEKRSTISQPSPERPGEKPRWISRVSWERLGSSCVALLPQPHPASAQSRSHPPVIVCPLFVPSLILLSEPKVLIFVPPPTLRSQLPFQSSMTVCSESQGPALCLKPCCSLRGGSKPGHTRLRPLPHPFLHAALSILRHTQLIELVLSIFTSGVL